jgi:hypothetical protein
MTMRHVFMFRSKASSTVNYITTPNPQVGGQPLVRCPQLLIQYILSYPPYWRPSPDPHPEDAPYRGDRDPLMSALVINLLTPNDL